MGGISLTVHPLFYVFGFYYALTGRIFVFVIYTVSAVLHELGHSFVASGAGYKLNKITLMPFGAVVKGNIDGLKFADEIKIALAGPFLNLAVGLFFVACWWIFPETYAFTDVVAGANFSMALVNFLPIFPLDGGRVLWAFLSTKMGEKKADVICKIVGAVFSLLLVTAFIFTLFYQVNLSLLFFSLFVLFGAFGRSRKNEYVRIFSCVTQEKLFRGMPIKMQAVSSNTTLKRLVGLLDLNAMNRVEVYDGKEKVATLSQKQLEEIIEKGEIYSPIGKFL
jgi:Zn-dependent protease